MSLRFMVIRTRFISFKLTMYNKFFICNFSFTWEWSVLKPKDQFHECCYGIVKLGTKIKDFIRYLLLITPFLYAQRDDSI